MKVQDLSGRLLNYWVDKANGNDPKFFRDAQGIYLANVHKSGAHMAVPNYCGDWSVAGPIIERNEIDVCSNSPSDWSAFMFNDGSNPDHCVIATSGPTPIIASMRCFVASKFGEEVADISPEDT